MGDKVSSTCLVLGNCICKWISNSRQEIRPDWGRVCDRDTQAKANAAKLTVPLKARSQDVFQRFYIPKLIQPDDSW